MGLLDKMKDAAKNADDKIGNAIDKEKIDSKIRENQRSIDRVTEEIGQKVVGYYREGREIDKTEIDALYSKIAELLKTNEELEVEKGKI